MIRGSAVKGIVRRVLEERFQGVRIDDIVARVDVDDDSDRYWYIDVIMEKADVESLDDRKALSVVRHLLPHFAEAGEEGFPVLSFIARSEFRKRPTEAA